MTREQRHDITRALRRLQRARAALLESSGVLTDEHPARVAYRRELDALARLRRRWTRYGLAVYDLAASEAARYVTEAGELRREHGARVWMRGYHAVSIDNARTWNRHAAGRLPA